MKTEYNTNPELNCESNNSNGDICNVFEIVIVDEIKMLHDILMLPENYIQMCNDAINDELTMRRFKPGELTKRESVVLLLATYIGILNLETAQEIVLQIAPIYNLTKNDCKELLAEIFNRVLKKHNREMLEMIAELLPKGVSIDDFTKCC